MQDERYALYFSENLEEILNERELLISNNGISQLYRPDRVIKTQEGFVIIDFKTGEPQKPSTASRKLQNCNGKFGEKGSKNRNYLYITPAFKYYTDFYK